MTHLSIEECRRIERIALDPSTGRSHRIGIVDTLRNTARERQADPNSSPDELAEVIGMLLGIGEP